MSLHCACRPEMKFDGVPALMAQIRTDIGTDLCCCCRYAYMLAGLVDVFA